ncbi:MAG: ABC transporter permease [Bryobacterales bacterium]|nr:ABC transporter permease [Bryobacterales bacterium]
MIGFRDARVAVSDGAVEAAFTAENRSRETWSPEEGYAFGLQIFDRETGMLVEDGIHLPVVGAVAPGGRANVSLRGVVPPGDGRYRLISGPLREGVAWFHERGAPFLMADFDVCDGAVRVLRSYVMQPWRLAAERILGSLGRALTLPFATLWTHRSLIRTMARRDVVSRYRGSLGGSLWTVLWPLLLMLTYFFVFGVVLEARFAGDTSRTGFALYFLTGMLPWLPFSEAAGRAPSVLLEHRNFVKKLVFPVETLPANLTVAGLFTGAVALALLMLALFYLRGAVPMTALWLPVLLIPQAAFTVGLCWFLSALGVFARDLGQMIGLLLTLWFFLTPICYPEASLPPAALPVLSQSPIYILVRGYRDVLLEARMPDPVALAKLWGMAAVAFLGGYAWFHKLRRSFADVI